MAKIDLFDFHEKLPKKVKDILSKPIYNSVMTYARCKKLVKELEKVGYTCEYGLDASPYNLQKMTTKNSKSQKMELFKISIKDIKELKKLMLWYTKQSNEARQKRNSSKLELHKKGWQAKVDLAEKWKKSVKAKIDLIEKQGLKGTLPKGMTKVVAKSVKVTGLKKSNGTLEKGFKYIKGGKIVKVSPKKSTKKTK